MIRNCTSNGKTHMLKVFNKGDRVFVSKSYEVDWLSGLHGTVVDTNGYGSYWVLLDKYAAHMWFLNDELEEESPNEAELEGARNGIAVEGAEGVANSSVSRRDDLGSSPNLPPINLSQNRKEKKMTKLKIAVVSKDGKVNKKQFEKDMLALSSMAKFMSKKTAKKPSAKKPSAKKSSTKKPSAKKSSTKKSSAKKPSTKKSKNS